MLWSVAHILHCLPPLGVGDGDATAAGGSVFRGLLRLGAIGLSVASLCREGEQCEDAHSGT